MPAASGRDASLEACVSPDRRSLLIDAAMRAKLNHGALRSFARRLLVQAIVSGTVMAGLQVAARFGPEVFPPPQRTTAREGAGIGPTGRPAFMRPAAAHVSADRFAEDPTRAACGRDA